MSTTKKLSIELIRKLPKAELHCHLDGAVRVSTIIELAKEQNVTLPTFDEEELKKLVQVDENCESLVEYLRGFDISLSVMQKKYAIARIMYEVCEDATKDGITYLEVRFSPILHTREGLSLTTVMEAICEGRALAQLKLPILPRIIVCGMRQMDPTTTKQLAELAFRYKDKGVVAFDLAGPENGFSSKFHAEAFQIVHNQLLNCTLHSGEASSYLSVQDSIRYCNAHRLGHGVRARERPALVQYIATNRIPVEICLTSNVQTKCIQTFRDHPCREFFDMGVVIVPCTDNPTVSNVTLSQEYLNYQEYYHFTPSEIVRLIDYSFKSAFVDLTMKRSLRAEAMKKCKEVLLQEGFTLEQIFKDTLHLRIGSEFPMLRSNYNPIQESKPLRDCFESKEKMIEFVKQVPKAELNVRLSGSCSIELFWKFYCARKEEFDLELELLNLQPFETMDELRRVIQFEVPNLAALEVAQEVMALLLQHEEHIMEAMENIYIKAKEENVVLMELHVRPTLHCRRRLHAEDVLQIVLRKKEYYDSKYGITTGIVLYNNLDDGVELIKQTALLTVKYKDQVLGYGIYRTHDFKNEELFQRLIPVTNFLKNHEIKIVVSCGFHDTESVIKSLMQLGASRISGAFAIHSSPDLMAYLANHNFIAVETNIITDLYKDVTHSNTSISVLELTRLLIDRGVKIACCSFDSSLYEQIDRTETLVRMIDMCQLTLKEFVNLTSTGVLNSFMDYQVKRKLMHLNLKLTENLVNDYKLL